MAVVKKNRDNKDNPQNRDFHLSVKPVTNSSMKLRVAKKGSRYAGVFLSKDVLDKAKKTTEAMAGKLTQEEKNTFVTD